MFAATDKNTTGDVSAALAAAAVADDGVAFVCFIATAVGCCWLLCAHWQPRAPLMLARRHQKAQRKTVLHCANGAYTHAAA